MKVQVKRYIFCFVGVLLLGIAVGLMKYSCFGVDPFQSLVSGFEQITPIEYGLLYIIINAIFFIASLIFEYKLIGLGTILNLFGLGYIIQYALEFLTWVSPNPNIISRILFYVGGILLHTFSCAMYIAANKGISTYDALSLIPFHKLPKISFKFWRIAVDVLCALVGAVLCFISGMTFNQVLTIGGIGTVISAFLTGPLIELWMKKVMNPLLQEKVKESEE